MTPLKIKNLVSFLLVPVWKYHIGSKAVLSLDRLQRLWMLITQYFTKKINFIALLGIQFCIYIQSFVFIRVLHEARTCADADRPKMSKSMYPTSNQTDLKFWYLPIRICGRTSSFNMFGFLLNVIKHLCHNIRWQTLIILLGFSFVS